MSKRFVITKVGEFYFNEDTQEYLPHIKLSARMLLVLQTELQKMPTKEKEVLFLAESDSVEFNDFANKCLRQISSNSFFGDFKYQVFDWLGAEGKRLKFFKQ